MSEPLPERADVRQLRIQSKELLRALHASEPAAIALAKEHDPTLTPLSAKLSDAQRLIARKQGFDSWPALTHQVELPRLLEAFRHAISRGDAEALEKLLRTKPALRKHIDDPIFDFDSPAIVNVSGHPRADRLIPILARYGADPNVRTKWWAGSFGALDHSSPEVADLLVSLGAKYDVWSASAKGRIDILEELLTKDPSSVDAPGGDGQRPLHVAMNAETAEFLISKGADLEILDIDHESTPIQYQVDRPEVVRVLLKHGAKPDIFTAVVLDDIDLMNQVIAKDPNAPMARVCKGEFATKKSNGGHIYQYNIGAFRTPQIAAAQRGSKGVLAALVPISPPERLLVVAAATSDQAWVRRLMSENPDLIKNLTPEDAAALPYAAQNGNVEMLRLLLEAGVDPTTTGMDNGTGLHLAAWFGQLETVKIMLEYVPIETRDKSHGSTALGWAAHGAANCWKRDEGDYVGVVKALIAAGADVHAPANSGGTPMLEQAGDREDVKAVLRKHLSRPT